MQISKINHQTNAKHNPSFQKIYLTFPTYDNQLNFTEDVIPTLSKGRANSIIVAANYGEQVVCSKISELSEGDYDRFDWVMSNLKAHNIDVPDLNQEEPVLCFTGFDKLKLKLHQMKFESVFLNEIVKLENKRLKDLNNNAPNVLPEHLVIICAAITASEKLKDDFGKLLKIKNVEHLYYDEFVNKLQK